MTSPEHVDRFRRLLGRRLGLRIRDEELSAIEDLLAVRSKRRGAEQYLRALVHDEQEWRALIETLTVGETYFMRNRDQLDVLFDELARRSHAGRRTFRILSAGCSSGEEPYSIAILARERLPPDCDVSIVGVDINQQAIARAQEARFAKWSMRQMSDDLLDRYFTIVGGRYELRPDVRGHVELRGENLVDPRSLVWKRGPFDVVLCRNVLMYLLPLATQRVIDHFAEALRPGGLLFLGHTENLRHVSSRFTLQSTRKAFYYLRDPEHAVGNVTVEVDMPIAPVRRAQLSAMRGVPACRRVPPLSRPETVEAAITHDSVIELIRKERFSEALQRLGEHVDPPSRVGRLLLRAVLLMNMGRSDEALAICAQLLAFDDLNPSAHYVMALCQEDAGETEVAIEHDRTAIYLDSRFAMPHLHLGLLLRRVGQHPLAARCLDRAATLLENEEASRLLLFGGSFSREELVGLCRSLRVGYE